MGVIKLNADRPRYNRPEPITPNHRVDGFESGMEALDDWLRGQAVENEGRASRTFVVTDAGQDVRGYYTLATGSVTRQEVPRKIRHNLPNPVPVMVLGRLAIDRQHQGRGLGSALLKDAMARTLRVSLEAGVRALIVHAIDDDAVTFYAKYGFQVFPPETQTLFLPIETLRAAL